MLRLGLRMWDISAILSTCKQLSVLARHNRGLLQSVPQASLHLGWGGLLHSYSSKAENSTELQIDSLSLSPTGHAWPVSMRGCLDISVLSLNIHLL